MSPLAIADLCLAALALGCAIMAFHQRQRAERWKKIAEEEAQAVDEIWGSLVGSIPHMQDLKRHARHGDRRRDGMGSSPGGEATGRGAVAGIHTEAP